MQLANSKNKFNIKKVEQMLKNENKFITDLFALTAIPDRNDLVESDEEARPHHSGSHLLGKKSSRAKSLLELQNRLQAITSKKKLTYKEKLTKKGLKNRMKKKSKQDERNSKHKLERAQKLSKTELAPSTDDLTRQSESIQPVFNKEDKMVYSKIEFGNIGTKKKPKREKDPKKILQKLEKHNEKIQILREAGENEKAIEIKEKTSWKNALAKAEGQKIKDDPALLVKSVKKKEQKQRSSKKKWDKRIQGVEKAKEERQQKRTENIQKRKKAKKTKEFKKAAKRGKIIPGF